MFHRLVFLPIAASTTAIAAFQEREAGATAGHPTAGASNYTPKHGENYKAADDNSDYDRPSDQFVSQAPEVR